MRSISALCFARTCDAGVTVRGDAFWGLVALSARPLFEEGSRDGGRYDCGGATSNGSGDGLELVYVKIGDAIPRASDGRGAAVYRHNH